MLSAPLSYIPIQLRAYLFNVELLHRLCGRVDGILLHLLAHVSVLDNCLAVRHDDDGVMWCPV